MDAMKALKDEEVEFRVRTASMSLSLQSFTGAGSHMDIRAIPDETPHEARPLEVTVLKREVPDGGYGWVIVACTICNLFFYGHLFVSFSMMIIAFKEANVFPGCDTGAVSLLMSVRQLILYVVSLIASAPIKVVGLRATMIGGLLVTAAGLAMSAFMDTYYGMFITFTIITGIGQGFTLVPPLTIVQLYFDKRRALAAGISLLGFSIATLLSPISTQYMLELVGWRGTLLLQSGTTLQSIVFAALYRPLPSQQALSTSKLKDVMVAVAKDVTDFRKMKNIWFIFHCFTGFGMFVGMFGTLSHVPSRLVWRQHSKEMAAVSMIFMGSIGLLARILYSVIANLQCTNRLVMYGSSIFIAGVVIAASIVVPYDNYWALVAFNTAYLAITSSAQCTQITVIVDMFGIEGIARATSIVNSFNGMGGLAGIFFAGWLFDKLQDYDLPFCVLGVVQACGGLVFLVMAFCTRAKSVNTDIIIETDVALVDKQTTQPHNANENL